MTRLKHGKGNRKQNFHQDQFKEHEKASPISADPNGGAARRDGEGAKADVMPKRPMELAPANAPLSEDIPNRPSRRSQTWMSYPATLSGAGGPAAAYSDGFESLLDGLTGAELHTAKQIVQALRSPEVSASAARQLPSSPPLPPPQQQGYIPVEPPVEPQTAVQPATGFTRPDRPLSPSCTCGSPLSARQSLSRPCNPSSSGLLPKPSADVETSEVAEAAEADSHVTDRDRDQSRDRGKDRDLSDSRNSQRGWNSDRDRGSWAGDPRVGGEWDWQQYMHWSNQPHRDSAVVEVDVARSLWAFTRDHSEEQREARRRQLKRLLNAVVAAHEGDVFYYQGLHDVASVLLMSMPGAPPQLPSLENPPPPSLIPPEEQQQREQQIMSCHMDSETTAATACRTTVPSRPADTDTANLTSLIAVPDLDPDAVNADAARGELLAFGLLRRLVTTHLRDATRPSLEPVVQLLGLVPYLVRAADPVLARRMGELGLQPFFALSWFLTWWAHELDQLAHAARLYDFFIASHPLMPLYLGAVAMRSQRAALLACEEMPELHSALTNLKLVMVAASGSSRGGGDGGNGSGYEGRGRGRGTSGGGGRGRVALEILLRQTEQLWRAKPPHGRPALWRVPAEAPVDWADGTLGTAEYGGFRSGLGRILSLGARSRAALLSTALLAGVYVAAAMAIGYATFSRSTALESGQM
ncbi:hypothetical protein VOLCADRAFT_99675 [Volvox carteri f. nagariensis]|uniref:Rab-GAP TBC domain-containing protein n=1 Tax=Volvox carteri f. nagariensis TaxID=3068 RepID=D8UIC3_VOLCA|nr:uncharacterized protein VOLCADRAFT_99675 [Volvox carteri f. nagariensis]EFJ40542.1 hypothetical protein VOLCADRAFT_99675 [Volvox carteri f. nagariensis]|eukprot:XP_002958392.1 hypothetical protein VOLCADRAFT_99675 [Volvox carteri f. nagariensis]